MSDYSLHSTILFYKTPGGLPCHFMASRVPFCLQHGVTTVPWLMAHQVLRWEQPHATHRQPLASPCSGTHSPSPAHHGPAGSPGTGACPPGAAQVGDTCYEHDLAPAERPALGSSGVFLWICKLFRVSLRSPSGVRSWHGTKPRLQQQA